MAQQPAEEYLQAVKDQVAKQITIASHRDTLSHASTTIEVLKVAEAEQFPIHSVRLFECSPRVDGLNLILQSDLSLSTLTSLQTLVIHDVDRNLTNEEWSAILSYSAQCTSLQMLKFFNYVVQALPVESIPTSLRARNVKVSIMRTVGSFIFTCRLDLETGEWQASDIGGILPGEEGFDEESYPRSRERFNQWQRASSSDCANQ
ncbi:uncharacterized protein [Apostichopus japonicus]|uniref:uncharacterized protein n=1 Tax=Stichopus japonicus TaxID=307972 RepID=UPI003AB8AEA7